MGSPKLHRKYVIAQSNPVLFWLVDGFVSVFLRAHLIYRNAYLSLRQWYRAIPKDKLPMVGRALATAYTSVWPYFGGLQHDNCQAKFSRHKMKESKDL